MAFANRYTGKALRPACQPTADLPAQAAIGNVAISPVTDVVEFWAAPREVRWWPSFRFARVWVVASLWLEQGSTFDSSLTEQAGHFLMGDRPPLSVAG